jgi:hypothetical protein
MPSNPSLQTALNISPPSPSVCSTYWMPRRVLRWSALRSARFTHRRTTREVPVTGMSQDGNSCCGKLYLPGETRNHSIRSRIAGMSVPGVINAQQQGAHLFKRAWPHFTCAHLIRLHFIGRSSKGARPRSIHRLDHYKKQTQAWSSFRQDDQSHSGQPPNSTSC